MNKKMIYTFFITLFFNTFALQIFNTPTLREQLELRERLPRLAMVNATWTLPDSNGNPMEYKFQWSPLAEIHRKKYTATITLSDETGPATLPVSRKMMQELIFKRLSSSFRRKISASAKRFENSRTRRMLFPNQCSDTLAADVILDLNAAIADKNRKIHHSLVNVNIIAFEKAEGIPFTTDNFRKTRITPSLEELNHQEMLVWSRIQTAMHYINSYRKRYERAFLGAAERDLTGTYI